MVNESNVSNVSFSKATIIQRLLKSENSQENEINIEFGIYIYGAGELGILALEYCEACDISIIGFIDQNKNGKIEGKKKTYLIQKNNEINIEIKKNYPILVAIVTEAYSNIFNSLKENSWEKVYPFYQITNKFRDGHPLSNGWTVGKVSQREIKKVQFIIDNFSDKHSIEHYEAFIAWHIDKTELIPEACPISHLQRYSITPFLDALSNRDSLMIDVGSHGGESIAKLINKGIQFSEYILVEPDEYSRKKLLKIKNDYLSSTIDVKILDLIIGKKHTYKRFISGLGYCSQICDDRGEYKEVNTIDSLNYKPDLIKIHTEGSELDVLVGAIQTIEKHKPVIVYSLYHNRDGLCRLIEEPMKKFKGYKWYFRLHNYQGTGAFMYGIPLR